MATIPISLASSKVDKSVYSSSDFTVRFSPPLHLGSLNYAVACVKLNAWYSTHNIASDLNNNNWRYSNDGGSSFSDATIPDGNYSIPDLDSYLKTDVYYPAGAYDPNAITGGTGINDVEYLVHLVPNYNTNRVKVRLDDPDYQVDFTQANNLSTFLGHDEEVVTATKTGASIPEVSNGVDTWVLHCDLVSKGYSNGNSSDVLLSFTPDVPPQAAFDVEPYNPTYVQVNKETISSIRIRLTDQNGNPLDLEGEDVVISLSLKAI
jgi:hypothetical protein